MSQTYRFWKYQGTGNDFVLAFGSEGDLDEPQVARICDRHTGVGADGVIRVLPPSEAGGFPGAADADFIMDYRNADGSVAEMCGNGIRCLAAFVHDRGLTSARDLRVATRDGVKRLTIEGEGPDRVVSVEMGPARFEREALPMEGPPTATFLDGLVPLDDVTVVGSAVSMGNPHLVVFSDDLPEDSRVQTLGPQIERHEYFPERTNVEFVRAEGDGVFSARVWERGVGETLACGTGACAVVAAAHATDRGGEHGTVRFPGGDVVVELRDCTVTLTGPAVEVFDGSIDL